MNEYDSPLNMAAPGMPTSGKLGAPSKQSLVGILRDKRMALLDELRNVEQALEALEQQPAFEPTMERVLKILHRSY